MTCEECREIVSARLDGEATAAEEAAASRHLARCVPCRRLDERLTRLTRRARSRAADDAPDLVDAVLARLPAQPGDGDGDGDGGGPLAPVVATVVPAGTCGCRAECGCGCQRGRACRCGLECADGAA